MKAHELQKLLGTEQDDKKIMTAELQQMLRFDVLVT
jgi:hypothetical protein